ncbi:MAG: hypothetical protein K2Y40_15625 [Reyranella sp.]|nr:hypothetical protein [Reyranella sp.]
MKAPSVIGRGFLRSPNRLHVWTAGEQEALQAGLNRLIDKHGLGVGRIVVDGADVVIQISGGLEPGEVAILLRWLEAETARIEAS